MTGRKLLLALQKLWEDLEIIERMRGEVALATPFWDRDPKKTIGEIRALIANSETGSGAVARVVLPVHA